MIAVVDSEPFFDSILEYLEESAASSMLFATQAPTANAASHSVVDKYDS